MHSTNWIWLISYFISGMFFGVLIVGCFTAPARMERESKVFETRKRLIIKASELGKLTHQEHNRIYGLADAEVKMTAELTWKTCGHVLADSDKAARRAGFYFGYLTRMIEEVRGKSA